MEPLRDAAPGAGARGRDARSRRCSTSSTAAAARRYAIKRFVRYALRQLGRALRAAGRRRQRGPAELHPRLGTPTGCRCTGSPGPVGRGPDGLEVVPSDGWYGWCEGAATDPLRAAAAHPARAVHRPAAGQQPSQQPTTWWRSWSPTRTSPRDQTWRNRMLLFSDDAYSVRQHLRRRRAAAPLLLPELRGRVPAAQRDHPLGDRGLGRAARAATSSTSTSATGCANEPTVCWTPPVPARHRAATQNRTRADRDAGAVLAPERRAHVVELPGPRQRVRARAREPLPQRRTATTTRTSSRTTASRSCSPRSPATPTRSPASARARRRVGPSLGEEMVTLPAARRDRLWASVGYEIVPAQRRRPHQRGLGARDVLGSAARRLARRIAARAWCWGRRSAGPAAPT